MRWPIRLDSDSRLWPTRLLPCATWAPSLGSCDHLRPDRVLTWANGRAVASSGPDACTVIPRCSPLCLVRLWCGRGALATVGRLLFSSPEVFVGGRTLKPQRQGSMLTPLVPQGCGFDMRIPTRQATMRQRFAALCLWLKVAGRPDGQVDRRKNCVILDLSPASPISRARSSRQFAGTARWDAPI